MWSPAELAYIQSDPPDPVVKIPWLSLLRYRQTWAYTIAMFLVSPVWWFYLYWIPDFLNKKHGLDLVHMGPPLVAIYVIADVGSVAGGWEDMNIQASIADGAFGVLDTSTAIEGENIECTVSLAHLTPMRLWDRMDARTTLRIGTLSIGDALITGIAADVRYRDRVPDFSLSGKVGDALSVALAGSAVWRTW